ncbi:MAG: universal stress protein [Halobacteriales archaeon]
MYERILVPTDGSTVAEAAADAGVELARRFGAEIHAVNVVRTDDGPPGETDERGDELVRMGREAVAAVEDRAADAGVEATTAVIEDAKPVHRALLEYVDDHDVDAVVMGTYGRSGFDRFVVGSVAERTLRESPVPVVTVHGETVVGPEFDAVLAPTDGSDAALAAVEHAAEFALATGATLHVVHVIDSTAATAGTGAAAVLDALEEAGQAALDDAVDRAEAVGVGDVETSLLRGSPHRAVLDYAGDHGADAVVMGTHGRTGIQRYLLGSVTERVVRHAEVPVVATGTSEDTE